MRCTCVDCTKRSNHQRRVLLARQSGLRELFPYGDPPPGTVMCQRQQPLLSSQKDALMKADLALMTKVMLLCMAVVAGVALIGCAAALRQAETITHQVTDCVFNPDPEGCKPTGESATSPVSQ